MTDDCFQHALSDCRNNERTGADRGGGGGHLHDKLSDPTISKSAPEASWLGLAAGCCA